MMLFLAEDLLEVVGEDDLLELARERLVPREEEVLRELHRDGARAAHEAPGLQVRDDGRSRIAAWLKPWCL